MIEEPKTIEPEQFKFLLNGKSSRPQHHIKYDYYKASPFEVNLDEFISYAEVRDELKLYGKNYEKYYDPWNKCTATEKQSVIQQACDSLDLNNQEERINQAKCLAYIALGCFDELADNQIPLHLSNMKENNQLLFQMDILTVLKQSLNHGSHYLELSSNRTGQAEPIELYCKEIDIYLTILFLVVECNLDKEMEEYQLIEFLFDLIVKLKEHFTKTFPLKKLMMCIYKVLLNTLGELGSDYAELKSGIRVACDLPLSQDKSAIVKCTVEDLFAFYQQTCDRYPTFSPVKPSDKISDPLTVFPSTRLSKAMGVHNASKSIDFPYQTLFPSKSQQPTQPQLPLQNKKSLAMEATNVLPFSDKSTKEPFTLNEATKVWLNHLYISVADYQIVYEREKAVHRWQRWNENNARNTDDWQELIYDKLKIPQQKKMNRIEHLYSSIVPHFQNIVVVILKLLLSTVSINKDKEAEIIEDINITRNRESISKAVSGILLLLLKWFKQSHVLKFEYLSQVLVDSGCMLLILKLLGLQEVALLASKKTDDDSQSFLGFLKRENSTAKNGQSDLEEEEQEYEELYTNERNLHWTINLLRILQMLTKRKTHRIVLLVQYKSSAILKRLLKVGHPTVDYYVLKNLKNQVPFMGRKWRSSNMKTISAIYSHIMTSLNDDWLSCPDGSADTEDGATKEIDLRILARLYNGQRYLPNILPKMDDIVGEDSTVFYVNNYTHSTLNEEVKSQLPEYNINLPIVVDDVELDIDFKKDYRQWLETNIYTTAEEEEEDEEEDEEDEVNQTNMSDKDWHIDTPIPDTVVALSAEDLTREINKLYLEELEREFAIKQQKQLEIERSEDGWDQPAAPSSSAWGSFEASSDSGFIVDDEDVDADEPDFDPLQGIDWNNLTEEELKKRLTVVEEKTVKRWMNVDMNDPSYMKVLNTFEGEIPEDDEGWPI